jgi:S1-C subfamily serine protease
MISMLLILSLASGCTSVINEWTNKESEPLKEPSLTLYGITHIKGEPLNSFINNRVAIVYAGAKISQPSTDPNTISISSKSRGLATAISKNGYFLTAAHCVETKDDTMILFPSAFGLRIIPARVVWLSKDYDIALIRIDNMLKYCFEMAQSLPDPNTTAVVGGGLTHSAGRIHSFSKISPADDGLVWINHSCPIVDGDSGGPLLSKEGLLLGINHSTAWKIKWFSVNITEYVSTAINSKWVMEIMNRDIGITSQSMGRPEGRP